MAEGNKGIEGRQITGSDHTAEMVRERIGGTLSDSPILLSGGIVRVSGLGDVEFAGLPKEHCFPHFWVAAAIERGQGRAITRGAEYPLVPGCCYLVPPGVRFQEKIDSDWKFYSLLIQCSSPALMSRFDLENILLVKNAFGLLEKIRESVEALQNGGPQYEIVVAGNVLALIGNLTGTLFNSEASMASPQLRKAIRILHNELFSPPDFASLARQCGVSASLLSHQFRQYVGMSPMQYSRSERIKAAKKLILSGVSIKETAGRLGFKNQFHFSRIFRQVEGVAPRDFLKVSALR